MVATIATPVENKMSDAKWSPVTILEMPRNNPNPITKRVVNILIGSFHFFSLTKINNGKNIHPIAVWPEGNEAFPFIPLSGPGGKNHGV